MLTGIRLKAIVIDHQRLVLNQWIGCARLIWNCKCDENLYYSAYARKYCPIGTYAPIDKKYSHFEDDDLSPWLSDCPSKILANSACKWFDTYQNFMKDHCGKPRRKKKTGNCSIHLTRDLFRFEACPVGVRRLFIGAERNNIGYLSFKLHKGFQDLPPFISKSGMTSFGFPFGWWTGSQG